MTGFGTLRKLDFYHFYVFKMRSFFKMFVGEISIFITTAEISGSDIPNNIATTFKMIRRKTAFACIVVKTALFCASI
mgnify:CR=1 FL=1